MIQYQDSVRDNTSSLSLSASPSLQRELPVESPAAPRHKGAPTWADSWTPDRLSEESLRWHWAIETLTSSTAAWYCRSAPVTTVEEERDVGTCRRHEVSLVLVRMIRFWFSDSSSDSSPSESHSRHSFVISRLYDDCFWFSSTDSSRLLQFGSYFVILDIISVSRDNFVISESI